LTAQLAELPKQPTIVGFEVGIGQAEAVAAMLRGCAEWDEVSFVRDLGGIDRHVIAVRAPK
jgi:release factor glutamine methyltransferase